MKIRQLTRRTKTFNAFRKSAWDTFYQGLFPEQWSVKFTAGSPLYLEAKIGRKIVGAICGSMWGGVTGIEELVVHPDHQGEGIGHELIKAAEAWTREHDGHALALQTGADWQARKFYRKVGFKEQSVIENYYFGQAFVWFVKRIGT